MFLLSTVMESSTVHHDLREYNQNEDEMYQLHFSKKYQVDNPTEEEKGIVSLFSLITDNNEHVRTKLGSKMHSKKYPPFFSK